MPAGADYGWDREGKVPFLCKGIAEYFKTKKGFWSELARMLNIEIVYQDTKLPEFIWVCDN